MIFCFILKVRSVVYFFYCETVFFGTSWLDFPARGSKNKYHISSFSAILLLLHVTKYRQSSHTYIQIHMYIYISTGSRQQRQGLVAIAVLALPTREGGGLNGGLPKVRWAANLHTQASLFLTALLTKTKHAVGFSLNMITFQFQNLISRSERSVLRPYGYPHGCPYGYLYNY